MCDEFCKCECHARNVLILPMDFLPAGFEFLSQSDGTYVVDKQGTPSPLWTKIMNDLSKGHDSIEFRSDIAV